MANYYASQGLLVLAAASKGGGYAAIVAPQDQNFDFLPQFRDFLVVERMAIKEGLGRS